MLAILETKVLGFEMIKDFYCTDPEFQELYRQCQIEPQRPFTVQQGFLFKGNILCIPKTPLRYALVREVHEGAFAGHFGIQKTLDMLAQNFFWPKMLGTVGKYILRCETCVKAKLTFYKGEYRPLPVVEKPWEHLSMDFIVALPRTLRGKDAIMVVVDRFSKMAHFVACHKTDDANYIANLYFAEIVRLHGIPKSIVSDRDRKFLSVFWTTLWKLLGTKLLFSTSYHRQTDGQTEVTNKTLGTILRTIVHKNLRDWDVKLDHAEFAFNRSPSLATIMSPFECVLGSNPLLPVYLIKLPLQEEVYKGAQEHAEQMMRIHKLVKTNIHKANAKYKRKADKGRKEQKQLQAGVWVWVHLRKDRFPKQRKNKLMPRAAGPYQISAKTGENAYQLDLGTDSNIHPTFNIGDLVPYQDSPELRTILPKEEGIETCVSAQESDSEQEENQKGANTNPSNLTAQDEAPPATPEGTRLVQDPKQLLATEGQAT